MTETCVCQNCGATVPSTQQPGFPDNGWDLPYDQFGYYGGFTDNLRVLVGEESPRSFSICHDCVLVLLDSLPGLKAIFAGTGGHPSPIPRDYTGCPTEYDPCCEFSWTLGKDKKVYQAQPDFTWKEVPQE